ncbi:hypothetical protein CTKA_00203 [Chthonomonas calidirosea]|uniref:Uncharacterized protein n=1 Tax=Chthonomonas calidirosea (strain DSM 23976 / ICMP 18418 / T49) TaxID=1303518 RepID=S0ETF2_CHTCT|nr:hypothetical protein CCALI_00957 [Chthonomonas calidirosea T49]CEK13820.1 hypothetical protein CTKA_00203 [Chthonomonas calidirosea]
MVCLVIQNQGPLAFPDKAVLNGGFGAASGASAWWAALCSTIRIAIEILMQLVYGYSDLQHC